MLFRAAWPQPRVEQFQERLLESWEQAHSPQSCWQGMGLLKQKHSYFKGNQRFSYSVISMSYLNSLTWDMDVPEKVMHNKVERIRVSKIFSSNATNILGMGYRNNTKYLQAQVKNSFSTRTSRAINQHTVSMAQSSRYFWTDEASLKVTSEGHTSVYI